MERKLWFKIFALLLLTLSALASNDNATAPLSTAAPETPAHPGPTAAPGTPTAGPEPGSSLDESGQVSVSNNNTEPSASSGLNGTTEEEPASTIPLKTSNDTTAANSSELPGVNETITSLPAPENHTSAAPSQPTTTSTTLGSTNKTETSPAPPPTSPPHLEITNTSQSDAPVQADNITATAGVTASTSTTPSTTAATTTTSTTTTTASTTTTTTTVNMPQGSTSAAKESDGVSHKTITPSQLNVGEETTVVHEAPTLDPLLAGLVSAFIIAAVIITLLLFLKLRRRDSRPEFRRLQDLPMDDMMEDTPLSMYSY